MKTNEQIINEALISEDVIPDTRANIILCKKILEIKEKEMLDDEILFLEKLFEDLTTDFPHYGFKLKENERILRRIKELTKKLEEIK